MTRAERMSVVRKGETKLRNIMKGQETEKYKKATGQDPCMQTWVNHVDQI